MTSARSTSDRNNLISVKAAAECSGYSQQYMRRLLRAGQVGWSKAGSGLVDPDGFFIDKRIYKSTTNS